MKELWDRGAREQAELGNQVDGQRAARFVGNVCCIWQIQQLCHFGGLVAGLLPQVSGQLAEAGAVRGAGRR